ncbi:hypothetical protein KKE03_00690, partial [Patescibacteria group bacterium]|nr:hypothetical protein [Patescibacteria group bacterium]
NIYKSNLREIAKFTSDEEFKSLYEGFDLEEQNRLYNRLERKQKAIIIQQAIKDGMDTRHLSDEERAIYAEFAKENGQDIYLDPADKLTLTRLGRARKIQQALEAGTDPKKLEGEDKIMYEEAKNAVDLAYEIYGAMGEKAKRGGGVFLVDRKDKEGRAFRDYLPSHLAEKFIHFAENWTQATYGEELTQELQDKLERKYLSSNEYKMLEDTLKRSGLSDQKRQEIERRLKSKYLLADELKYKVDQARRLAIWALKTHGYEAKLWDFTLLRNGKVIDPNTLGYTEYGVRPDKLDPIEKYRYAVPENPRILGYNSKGEGVILVFDDEGKLVTDPTTGLEFDPDTGKPLIFNKKPDEQNRQLIVFDNLNIHTRAERMLLKTPTGTIDPETKKMTVEGTENVHVDFDIATHHIYSRWTGHPYWGYQEEDAGLILTEEAFEGARAIKEGKLRWENAPPHAVQLLILDPTLNRVGHFDLEGLECVVNLAAGERSYLGHYRIGDELYMNFFPEDADRTKNRTAYVLQDHGGCTKQWFHMRAEAAYWPDYKVRRLRTFIPFMTLHFGSMSDMWGAPGGALDVFRMMGYKKYPMVGQFAMDKWVKQLGGAQDVYEAYSDWYSEQEKKLKEGLGKKLNNEADMLKKLYNDVVVNRDLTPPSTKEDKYEQFLITVRETLNRLEVVENRNTVLESLMRGERAPLNLEGIEIFRRTQYGAYILDNDGNRLYNPDIEKIEDSGSSRHSNKFLHYRYARFIRSLGYYRLYPDVAMYYKLMDNRLNDYPRLAEEASASNEMVTVKIVTGWDWLESKMNN